jgi:hypothetical protein
VRYNKINALETGDSLWLYHGGVVVVDVLVLDPPVLTVGQVQVLQPASQKANSGVRKIHRDLFLTHYYLIVLIAELVGSLELPELEISNLCSTKEVDARSVRAQLT